MAHNCRALVFRCMDFRLGKEIERFLVEQKLQGDSDIVSLAGSARNFLDPDAVGLMMKQVEISKRLHGITEVHLMNHTDCGAYGGKKAFDGDDAEQAQLVGDMRKAADLIKGKWPDLTVHIWMPHIDEEGHDTKVWIEKVE